MAQPTLETVEAASGSGGATFKVETVGVDVVPVSLLAYSTGDGTIEVVTDSGTESLPVTGPVTDTELRATPVPISGTVTANPASGTIDTVTTVSTVTNLSQLGGSAVPIGAGLEATAIRVTLPTDGTGVVTLGAGNANVGNVDIVTLPAGNLGQQLSAASLSATPATDIADATYIGDIKFGEALPAGSATIGAVNLGTIAGVATQTTLAAILVDTGQIETLLGTIDADTSNITECNTGAVVLASGTVTAVTDITNAVKVIGNAAEDAAVSGAPVLAAGRYDSTERATETGDATTLATSAEGWMMVGNQSSYLFDGVTRCQIKRVSGVAASGTTAIVAAVAGKKIRILALSLLSTSATVTNVYLATTTDTEVLGNSANPIPLAQDADGDNFPGFVMPYNQGGWTETSTANEDLNLILSAAEDVIYALTYIEVS